MIRTGLFTALALLLGGCTSLHVMRHVPLTTLSRLSTLTLQDIEPELLRVGARLPKALWPRPQGVKVQIDLTRNAGRPRIEDFTLEPVTDARELETLAPHRRAGAEVSVYRLSAADVGRLKRILSELNGPAGAKGVSVSVGVDACQRTPVQAGALLTTTYLRTNASGYFILTDDLDLRSVISERDIATNMPPCSP
jgi:hypothetical protein